jgi:uncharacterized protein YciI
MINLERGKMFIVLITYKKPLDIVEKYLAAHRSYLDEGYKNNFLIASGPRNPRTGGVLISQLNDKLKLEKFLNKDPFLIHDVADYEVIEFVPNKHHKDFQSFIK